MRSELFQQTVDTSCPDSDAAGFNTVSLNSRCSRWFGALAVTAGLACATVVAGGTGIAAANTGASSQTSSDSSSSTGSSSTKQATADSDGADRASSTNTHERAESGESTERVPEISTSRTERTDPGSQEDDAALDDAALDDTAIDDTAIDDTALDEEADAAAETFENPEAVTEATEPTEPTEPTVTAPTDVSSATLTTPGDSGSRDEDAPTDEAPQPRATARESETPVVNQETGAEIERPAETRENPVAVAGPTVNVLTPQPEDASHTSASAVGEATNITTAEKVPTAAVTAMASTTAAVEAVSLFEMLTSWWNRLWRNSAPILTSRQVRVTLDDSADVSDPIALGGADPDGDALSYSVSAFGSETGPKYGTVTIDQTTGTFTYNPVDALTVGTITDTFKVTVADSGFRFEGLLGFLNSLSNDKTTTAVFTVVVGAVNDAPNAVDDNFSGIVNSPVTGNVLINDTDPEGQTLTSTIVSGPTHGVLNFESDGNFTYTPNSNFIGTDGFTYRVSDGTNTSLVADVSLTMAAVSEAATPTVGVQGLSWWLGLSDADTNRALDMSKSAGVTSVRIDISWYVVEYDQGASDWSLIDPLVDKIVARDMTVLGMLYDTPAWLSGTTDPHAPPTDPQLFAQFAAATAEHYLGRINTWEVWNEQNIPRFWASPSPAAYAELLKAVYPAIKAVDPSATVITGGLSPDASGIDPLSFVTAMYTAGAGGYFDAISMHPYSFPQLPTIDSVKAVHDVMTANGDGAKKVWLTEVGAPTGTSPFAVSDETQALSIARFVDFARAADYVGPVYLYSILDTGSNLADPEDNFGLIRQDFTAKPAFGIWL